MHWTRPRVSGYPAATTEPTSRSTTRDNAAGDARSRRRGRPRFDWGDDRPPETPWHDTVIYEMHVKGFTKRHPDVPEELRGTYAGLASEPAIDYLQRLGVTAVELMPVHHFVDDEPPARARA